MQHFHSNGKLLLTGEYVVLDGAKALALPTPKGQSLQAKVNDKDQLDILSWISLNEDGSVWFSGSFKLNNFDIIISNMDKVAEKLQHILRTARKLNPLFLESGPTYEVTTKLEFNRNWGLGSSSTLINNIADWAQVNPFELLQSTFGGSGYDLVAAKINNPFIFQIINNEPHYKEVDFNPVFKDELIFIYLGNKMNSQKAVTDYKTINLENRKQKVLQINDITNAILNCNTLEGFEQLIDEHEQMLSELIQTPTVKEKLFADYPYPGSIKSLGAWGGDFALATRGEKNYFEDKGFKTIIPFNDMLSKQPLSH